MKLGNGRWESAKFNNRLQVTELTLGTSDGDGSLWKLAYEYGEFESGAVNQNKNTGNIAKQTLSFSGLAQPLVQTYKYDSLYRITEAKETVNNQQNWIQTYNYDRFGNRINFNQTGNGLAPTQPTINPQTNRFVTAGTNFIYDANGNLTRDGENRQFVFNGENKQTEVKANGALLSKYFYDGEGKRVKKQIWTSGVISEETIFVYSSGKLVAEYSTAPQPANPTTSYTATDPLGSPRVITNALGQVTSRRDFMPFGEELQAENNYRKSADFKYGQTDSVRQRFTGYQKDSETGLDFAEARMYESRHGRFTAVDPLLASGKSANPQTFNRYVYTMNRPLTHTDSLGLQAGQRIYSGPVYVNKDGNIFANYAADDFTRYKGGRRTVSHNGKDYSVARNSISFLGATKPKEAPLLLMQFGPMDKPNDSGFDPITPEDKVANLPLTVLSAVSEVSEKVENVIYTYQPDTLGGSVSIPVLGGIGIQRSKDGYWYGSYSKDIPSDIGGFAELVSKAKLKGGLSIGATYFIPSAFAEIKRPDLAEVPIETRDNWVRGSDFNIAAGFITYSHSLDEGEPDSATIGAPFQIGTDISFTRRFLPLNQMFRNGNGMFVADR